MLTEELAQTATQLLVDYVRVALDEVGDRELVEQAMPPGAYSDDDRAPLIEALGRARVVIDAEWDIDEEGNYVEPAL